MRLRASDILLLKEFSTRIDPEVKIRTYKTVIRCRRDHVAICVIHNLSHVH
jgi:ABC-type Mn2+/Zn2+ transport system ATPase subunit